MSVFMEAIAEAWLEICDGRTLPLHGVCGIGRASTNQLVFDGNDAISRNHAMISPMDSGGYWLLDMGSSNGTLLNGSILIQPKRLADGDEITIAGQTIFFRAKQMSSSRVTLAGSTMVSVRVAPQWLMLADIEGFTPMSRRMGTAELAHAVGRWFGQTREIVQACGGSINKYLGDGWLGHWNEAPTAVTQICECLGRMAMLRKECPHKFRLVLHHGLATISSGHELLGEDINFAFRMEKLAGALGAAVLISASANAKLALEPPVSSVGMHPLKGFGGSHEFYTWPV